LGGTVRNGDGMVVAECETMALAAELAAMLNRDTCFGCAHRADSRGISCPRT
jgi:hypothetical protein